jgi:hypothetical protein
MSNMEEEMGIHMQLKFASSNESRLVKDKGRANFVMSKEDYKV